MKKIILAWICSDFQNGVQTWQAWPEGWRYYLPCKIQVTLNFCIMGNPEISAIQSNIFRLPSYLCYYGILLWGLIHNLLIKMILWSEVCVKLLLVKLCVANSECSILPNWPHYPLKETFFNPAACQRTRWGRSSPPSWSSTPTARSTRGSSRTCSKRWTFCSFADSWTVVRKHFGDSLSSVSSSRRCLGKMQPVCRSTSSDATTRTRMATSTL